MVFDNDRMTPVYTDGSPELIPRISPQQIKSAPKLGPGVDLHAMVGFLKLFGVFGRTDTDIRGIAARLYETSWYREPDPETGQLVRKRDDQSAYLRFENVLRGRRSMMAQEIAFFRLCFRRAFGDNIGASITDEEIRLGSAHILVRRMLSAAPVRDWPCIDPVVALRDLAAACESRLEIAFEPLHVPRGWTERDDGPDITFPKSGKRILPPGIAFHLLISPESAPQKPIVLEFSDLAGVATDGTTVRAQLMPEARPTDYGYGPWRISNRCARPLILSDAPGSFGFLAISGAGHSVTQLFPDHHDPLALTDADLQHLYRILMEIGSAGQIPAMGMFRYTVASSQ